MAKKIRDIPSINKVLEHPEIVELIHRYSLNNVSDLVRNIVSDIRKDVLAEKLEPSLQLIVSLSLIHI